MGVNREIIIHRHIKGRGEEISVGGGGGLIEYIAGVARLITILIRDL